jgi:predicted alpha/beta superfamily hydrolase
MIVCGLPARTQSPAPKVTLDDTELRTLKSAKTGGEYDLLVSLPYDYATSGKSYPVLYVSMAGTSR